VILDGYHRLLKALLLNASTISVVRVRAEDVARSCAVRRY
jgi:hypothetical protein